MRPISFFFFKTGTICLLQDNWLKDRDCFVRNANKHTCILAEDQNTGKLASITAIEKYLLIYKRKNHSVIDNVWI